MRLARTPPGAGTDDKTENQKSNSLMYQPFLVHYVIGSIP